MERRSFVLRLKSGMKQEYVRRHNDLWPEMRSMLKEAGIRNYSIWWYEDTLFGYYETISLQKADQYKAQSAVQQRWNAYMADLISAEPGGAPEMVFYLP